jgi:adenosine deaminase
MSRPLADLHRHLDGSLRLATLHELARAQSPAVLIPEDIYFHKGMGLAQALACFSVTLSVLQGPAAVERVAAEICEDAQREGVSTLEIRFAPQLHKGATMERIVDAALAGLDANTGLILCALYGDDPDLVMALVELAKSRKKVVGLDLAGGPTPGQNWSLLDYAPAFRAAQKLGLGRTVHAGEGRPPEEIRIAIETLAAQRIGHGTTLLDDPRVTELVLQKEITIEACPSSNVHTGVIPRTQSHPLKEWLDLGIKVCVNTDNTLFSQVDAPAELGKAGQIPGMTDELVQRLIQFGHDGAFPSR